MKYKYSICHPEKEEIEYPDQILSAEQVKQIALTYPWTAELKKLGKLTYKEVHYYPSLDFTDQEDKYSFCLTAEGEPEQFSFSVWYNRPVMKKVLFGIFGKKEKLEVIDKHLSKDVAFDLLDKFLSRDYQSIESAMKI
jgi:hypothetical protein